MNRNRKLFAGCALASLIATSASAGEVYRLDDGVADDGFGVGDNAIQFIFLNRFVAEAGKELPVAIQVQFGSPQGPDIGNGRNLFIYLWSDPNQDGDPSDALVIDDVFLEVEGSGTDTLTRYGFMHPPTLTPGQIYFAGVYVRGLDPGSYAIGAMDTDGTDDVVNWPANNHSWVAWNDFTFPDPNDLDGLTFPVTTVSNAYFGNADDGTWMIRVIAFSPETDTFGSGDNEFDMKFVTVGDPDNPDDTTGYPELAGKVEYSYRMGQFEISEDQIDKANAIGGLEITHMNDGPNFPARSVTWLEAARFVNWLNTSTGHHPAYKFAIQPGEPGYGANQPNLLWEPGDPGYDPDNLFRNALAKYVLPSTDEWYKVAYYDPMTGVYYDYPTLSDTAPDPILDDDDVYYDAVIGVTANQLDMPHEVTDVGIYGGYGTAGVGGNVMEWVETQFGEVNNDPNANRFFRGGMYSGNSDSMLNTVGGGFSPPEEEWEITGFRVASLDHDETCIADIVTSATFQPPPDGAVDGADLAYLLGEWGRHRGSFADIVTSATFQPPPDGLVDGADLAYLLGAWGRCR